VELLLNKGADPDCEDLDRRTPLHSAIVKGSRCAYVILVSSVTPTVMIVGPMNVCGCY
jgi:ankyrin repeat protein